MEWPLLMKTLGHWYNHEIGKGNAPIVDTWWQTETGGIMISNLAGVTPAETNLYNTSITRNTNLFD